MLLKEPSQGAVAAADGADHLGGNHLAVLDIIEFKLFAVAEVLEHLTIFIRDRDLHNKSSFLYAIFSFPILTDCAGIGKGTRAFCAFWGGKHGRYVKVISETAVKCIIIEPEKRVKV